MVQFVKELFRYHETSVSMGHQLVQTLTQLFRVCWRRLYTVVHLFTREHKILVRY